MRNLITVFMITLLAFSCSSAKINEVKIAAAEKMQSAVVKELNEAYAGVSIEGHSCSAEADAIGQKVYDKVADLLKIKSGEVIVSNLSAKSVVGDSLPMLCAFVAKQVLVPLVEGASSEYKCLSSIGAAKFDKISADLCLAIDL